MEPYLPAAARPKSKEEAGAKRVTHANMRCSCRKVLCQAFLIKLTFVAQ